MHLAPARQPPHHPSSSSLPLHTGQARRPWSGHSGPQGVWRHTVLCDMVTVSAGCPTSKPSRAKQRAACMWSFHGHSRAAGLLCHGPTTNPSVVSCTRVPYHGIGTLHRGGCSLLLFITDEALSQLSQVRRNSQYQSVTCSHYQISTARRLQKDSSV